MNFNNVIISQVHIPNKIDVQGNLIPDSKVALVDLAFEHLRNQNPNSYLILIGHGVKPSVLHLADYVDWEDRCAPLDHNGYLLNNPGQATYIGKGIEHALSKGFTRALKVRGDSIYGIPNFVDYCETILQTENKKILLTQQTCHSSIKIGDCVLYGSLKILDETFNKHNPVHNQDGLINTGINFARSIKAGLENWKTKLKENISFRDTVSLKFADLRWNWNSLLQEKGYDKLREEILINSFDFRRYAWGSTNGWHNFDTEGNMIQRYLSDLISEKEWYA